MSLEEKATDAWAVYEYREHPKGLYHTCFVDGYQQGYEQAEKDLGWISVKDRLPQKHGWYITCYDLQGSPQGVGLSFYRHGNWYDLDDIKCSYNVDYWMEIPKFNK